MRRGSLLDEVFVDSCLQGVDTVLHLAAMIRKEKPEDILKTNVDGTETLLRAAKKNNIRRFIYISSENALREDLNDAYAVSKRKAEDRVR